MLICVYLWCAHDDASTTSLVSTMKRFDKSTDLCLGGGLDGGIIASNIYIIKISMCLMRIAEC